MSLSSTQTSFVDPLPTDDKEAARPAPPSATGPSNDGLAATLPPNGGLAAWSTVVGCWIGLFVQFGLCNSFGVFQAYYEVDLLRHKTPSDIAWIGTIQLFLLFFGGLFVGRFLDSHGSHLLLIPGSFTLVLSFMMISLCKEYYQLVLAQGLLFGIGCCLTFQPCVTCPSQWFSTKRALATGVAVSGSGVGGVVWPIIIKYLFDHVGFEWGCRAVGFIALGLMTICTILVKRRGPMRKPLPWIKVALTVKELRFTLLVLSVALSLLGAFVPFFFISTYATTLGTSSSLAFYCLSFMNAGSVLGRLSAGFATFFNPYLLLTLASIFCSLFLFAFWIPIHTQPALIAYSVIYGFVAGIWVSIIPACVAHMSPLPEIGMRIGLTWGLVSIAALVGPPIAGAIVNAHEGLLGFRLAAAFAGITLAAGSCFSLAVFLLDRRDKKRQAKETS